MAGGRRRGKVAWKAAHVGDADQAQACVAETVERFGGLDILVNNAGTNPYFGPMIDIDVPRAQKTFEVNQLAVLMWTSYAVKAGPAADRSSTWPPSAAWGSSRASVGTT